MSNYYVTIKRARIVYNEIIVMVEAKDPESAAFQGRSYKEGEFIDKGHDVEGPVIDVTEIVKVVRT